MEAFVGGSHKSHTKKEAGTSERNPRAEAPHSMKQALLLLVALFAGASFADDLKKWVEIRGASVYGTKAVPITGSKKAVTVEPARFVEANDTAWHTARQTHTA